jgi:hypothetical protein
MSQPTSDRTPSEANQSMKAVASAVPVLELRASDSYKLLAKLYPQGGWLEIKAGQVWYRIDVRALLAGEVPDKTLPMNPIRPDHV